MDLVEQDLQTTYQHDRAFKSVIDSCDHQTSFEDGWILMQGRFSNLQEFGMVDSRPHFLAPLLWRAISPIVKWEKNKNMTSLTDFSLEEILHAK